VARAIKRGGGATEKDPHQKDSADVPLGQSSNVMYEEDRSDAESQGGSSQHDDDNASVASSG
jgi:hypothetical protein